MVKERWKYIPEHPDYDVSNLGNVISWKRGENFIPLKKIKTAAQEQVSLDHQSVFVHELVAHAFVDNPNNLPYIRHKDGNGHNNVESNLEWSEEKEANYKLSEEGLKRIRAAQSKRRGKPNKNKRKKKGVES